jgi:hypothetical protein
MPERILRTGVQGGARPARRQSRPCKFAVTRRHRETRFRGRRDRDRRGRRTDQLSKIRYPWALTPYYPPLTNRAATAAVFRLRWWRAARRTRVGDWPCIALGRDTRRTGAPVRPLRSDRRLPGEEVRRAKRVVYYPCPPHPRTPVEPIRSARAGVAFGCRLGRSHWRLRRHLLWCADEHVAESPDLVSKPASASSASGWMLTRSLRVSVLSRR